ncbi:MAG: type II toxin-antitoxin system VapC family toxin [Phycisphaerae bacterium]|nr:type II toxin-antitoxin system VapC family toxin [Phycisphaerae bacterium]
MRVYADTSVFGGVFDEEFQEASTRFFEQVRLGRFELVSSAIVQAEIEPAPGEVKAFFDDMLRVARIVEVSDDAVALRQAYLDAGIVTRESADDALHVALATVSGCALIVSWNFRHIVHYRKITLYNAVNTLKGFPGLGIHSPQEVIEYEDQDV